MTEPLVCCVLLTRDRPEMARQAVECFRRQTYENKRLLVYHNGNPLNWRDYSIKLAYGDGGNEMLYERLPAAATVGELRNQALRSLLKSEGDIICHFDDDDYSHPNRISEQVALLQSTGADCVGYREMIFWDTRRCDEHETRNQRIIPALMENPCRCCGEAYLYYHAHPNYVLGGSMCYWRKTWERVPFPDKQTGEDVDWLLSGVHAIGAAIRPMAGDDPRMVCRIHGANTSAASYDPRLLAGEAGGDKHWQRRPEFDEHCRMIFGSNSERGTK